MMYEGDGTARSVYDWLDEGGYSCVLYFDGKQHAYVTDEDDDYGWQRIPVATARFLVTAQQISEWRSEPGKTYRYRDYRPRAWVDEWKRQYPENIAHCAGCGELRTDVQQRAQWSTDKRDSPDMHLCEPCYGDYLQQMDEADALNVYE